MNLEPIEQLSLLARCEALEGHNHLLEARAHVLEQGLKHISRGSMGNVCRRDFGKPVEDSDCVCSACTADLFITSANKILNKEWPREV